MEPLNAALLELGGVGGFIVILFVVIRKLFDIIKAEQDDSLAAKQDVRIAQNVNNDALLVVVNLLRDTVNLNTEAIKNNSRTIEAVVGLVKNLEVLIEETDSARRADMIDSEARIKEAVKVAIQHAEAKMENRWLQEDALWEEVRKTGEHRLDDIK